MKHVSYKDTGCCQECVRRNAAAESLGDRSILKRKMFNESLCEAKNDQPEGNLKKIYGKIDCL